MWTYVQSTGKLYTNSGEVAGTGYAGKGRFKNVPAAQKLEDKGPLPCGIYTIEPPLNTKTHGPYVMWLEPAMSNEMHGRSGFGIHGDSVLHPGTASEGCVIFARQVRQRIWESGDHTLRVISTMGLPDASTGQKA